HDVMVAVIDPADHFELNWTYQQSLYATESIKRWGDEFLELVEWMLLHPHAGIAECVPALATFGEPAPRLNDQQMRKDLATAGLSTEDALVIHRRLLVPGAEKSELEQFLAGARAVFRSGSVDLATRPDAWVQGSPFSLPSDTPTHLFTALCRTAERF